ncbi:hypothetical protein AA313_de0200359 [Arthrobotrys entomopaga]|nr:hypothetical protein AA313_de0200359 [Arthrobotrys entomopaga]
MTRRLSTRHQQNAKKLPDASKAKSTTPYEDRSSDIGFDTSTGLIALVGVKAFYTQEQRVKSFILSNARKRQSNSKKSKAQKWSWPPDHPAPELMARAGFYFKPAAGEEDNVACFICQKNMSEWDQDDDPAEQHLRHNSSCGWALTMCRDLVLNGEIICDPLGDEMCKARRMTFDDWWPHEGKDGWKPNVQNETGELNQKNEETPSDVKGGREKASKSRNSKSKKPVATTQRKKQNSRSQSHTSSGEPSNVVSEIGEINDDIRPKKSTRGKKRQSSLMEDGDKISLFSKDGTSRNGVEVQQANSNEHGNQYPHSTKRRITRASMAKAQSRSGFAGKSDSVISKDESSLPGLRTLTTESQLGDNDKRPTILSSSTTIQLSKQNISELPTGSAVFEDNEIDRILEKELAGESASLNTSDTTDGYHSSENATDKFEALDAPVVQEPEPVIQIPSAEPAEPFEALLEEKLSPSKKKFTRTHLLSETLDNGEQLPRSKLAHDNSSCTGLQEIKTSVGITDFLDLKTPGCSEAVKPENKTVVYQAEVDPVSRDTSQKRFESLDTETCDDALTVKTVNGSSPTDKHGSQRGLPAQLAIVPPPPISTCKDKDMKRKSDVVGDSEPDGRVGKKRKMAKSAKLQGILPESKLDPHSATASITDQSVADTVALSNKSPKEPNVSESLNPSPAKVKLPVASTKVKAKDQTSCDSQRVWGDIVYREKPISLIESAIAEGPTRETINLMTSQIFLQDSNVDIVTNEAHCSQKNASPTKSSSGKPLSPRLDASPSISAPPDDSASQDSILNTQFSASASQMTIGTSFQGSNKGVSFLSTADDQSLTQHDTLSDDIQETSVSASPKNSRTPLSIVAKAQNSALALLTPKDRTLGLSFAPVQSSKPWRSSDLEIYMDDMKENMAMDPSPQGLSSSERNLTVAGWVIEMSKRAEKSLLLKSEMLVRFFEDEAERAVAAIEAIETE